jgi:hypothetical protein
MGKKNNFLRVTYWNGALQQNRLHLTMFQANRGTLTGTGTLTVSDLQLSKIVESH